MEKIESIDNVAGLEFEDYGHIYRFDGVEVPSVSAIMEPLSRAKYGSINEAVLQRAADKGTIVHNAIENWIKFGIEDVPPEQEPYFRAFRAWWDENQPVPVASEHRMYHKLMRYAGTMDLVAYIGGELALVDYKTTATTNPMSWPVQLEAYAQALKSMGIEVERKKILHLKKTGKFSVHEYPINDAKSWRIFGSLKTVYDYVNEF